MPLSCRLSSVLGFYVTDHVYGESTSSTLFLILNLKIHYTSQDQVHGYDSERGGHLKTNNKLHATAKE